MGKTKEIRVHVAVIAALVLFGAGCAGGGTVRQEEQPVAQPAGDEAAQQDDYIAPIFTIDDIIAHDSAEDCWMAIDGAVYDMTGYVAQHPGGDTILAGCGKDATELFETRPMGSGTPHSERARDMLGDYYIGELE